MSRARCRGTRRTQLQLLAAATAINLKRLLSAQQARSDDQTDNRNADHVTITGLIALLTRCLTELGDPPATQNSTGS